MLSANPSVNPNGGRYGLIDVTLRDAHQCLWSTRMTTAMMAPILSTIDRVGYDFVNILGGAVFDVQVRYLHENPWERVGLLCEKLTTPCDGLTRGQSLYTFELFADDLVALNSQVLARRGLQVLTVYDALNDMRNVESSLRSAHDCGMRVNAMIVYALSAVHTDADYVERAREPETMGGDAAENRLHIFRQDHVAAVDEGPGARCSEQGQCGTRRKTVDEARVATGFFNQRLYIVDECGGCRDLGRRCLQRLQFRWCQGGRQRVEAVAGIAAGQQRTLGIPIRVTQVDAHQESIEL